MADKIEVDTLAEVGTLDVPSSFPRVVYRPYDREPRCSAVSEDRRKPDVETESDTAEEDSDDMDEESEDSSQSQSPPSSTITSRLGTRGPGAGDLQCLANEEPSAGSSNEPPPRPSW